MKTLKLFFRVAIVISSLPFLLMYNVFWYFFCGGKDRLYKSRQNIFKLTREALENEFPQNIGIEHKMMALTGRSVRLHVVMAGPEDGELVVLLHGYPDVWFSWKHQIIALAQSGYRVAVPDMRGYNLSEKPRGVTHYKIRELVMDVVALISKFERLNAHIISHDWGGVVAFYLAMMHPEKVNKLIVCNAPHPVAFRHTLLSDIRQALMSWYFIFNAIPFLAELSFLYPAQLYKSILPTADKVYLDLLESSTAQEYAATARLNYYRAVLLHQPPLKPIRSKTLIIWGKKDAFLLPKVADAEFLRQKWVPDIEMKHVDASHFLLHEKPDQVNQYILEFIQFPDSEE